MQKNEDDQRSARDIGIRIRTARTDRKVTLSKLARDIGLSEGFLSKLERGQTSSSIANLISIARSLGIDLQDLFIDSRTAPVASDVTVHRRSSDSTFSVIESTGYRWRPCAGGGAHDRMEVFHLVFPEENRMQTMVSHPGQEHCFVLSGEVMFFVADERHHLKAGDGIFIKSELPHRAENIGFGEAHVLMTVARPPEHDTKSVKPFLDWWRVADVLGTVRYEL
jgi:transcriptional regulator with XRE-family HTH domain/quercetin dioxygenase-like cupin family protein